MPSSYIKSYVLPIHYHICLQQKHRASQLEVVIWYLILCNLSIPLKYLTGARAQESLYTHAYTTSLVLLLPLYHYAAAAVTTSSLQYQLRIQTMSETNDPLGDNLSSPKGCISIHTYIYIYQL